MGPVRMRMYRGQKNAKRRSQQSSAGRADEHLAKPRKHGYVELDPARAQLTSNRRVEEHYSWSRANRPDFIALSSSRRARHAGVDDHGAFGIGRIKVEDSLSQLFRSETTDFKTFEEVTWRFPSDEFDVLIVVEGKNLLQRASIEKLRDLVTELQLIDGTRGIVSIFSARQPPQGDELPAPLFPGQLPEDAEYDRLIQRVTSNEIIHGKLLSEDGELTLIVLAVDPDVVASRRLRDVIANIQKTINEDLAGSGLTARLSGVPVMQLEIRNAVERDRLLYNAFGFAAGALIAIVFFRRLSFIMIGGSSADRDRDLARRWLDFRLNMFLNVMTPLIMVISFSDSMQLTFAARDRLLQGQRKYQAFCNAMLVVGPAWTRR
jgi:uncharacterized protein